MPINSQHPEYKARITEWEDCRTAFEGQRAIKAKGIRYLPRLLEQDGGRYEAYKDRALFYSITAKTVSAMVGMATARPAIVNAPEDMDYYLNDSNGVQFTELLNKTLSEVLLMGRYVHVIDAPVNGGELTIAQYAAESLINWRLDDFGNPIWVVFAETIQIPNQRDPYEVDVVTQYRKLSVETGVYTVEVFDDRGSLITSVIPTFTGHTIDYIPIVVCNALGVGFDVYKSPMVDIVDINISHYRTSADLEHGRHFCGLPTPVVSGADVSAKLRVGGESAWILPDHNAKAYFLEFTGQGLLSLEKALEEKQSQLASLSARLLDNSKRGSEAAETVRLRYMSETATLTSIVNSVENALNQLYEMLAVLTGEDQNSVEVKLNKEFLSTKLSAQDLVAYIKSYLEGGITKETLVYNLRRGDVLDPARSDVEELSQLNISKGVTNGSQV